MKKIYALSLLTIASCSLANEIKTDKITVLSKNLELTSDKGQCFLLKDTSKIPLTPKPPCYFLRDGNNNPQYFSYTELGVDAVLIVSGTPISQKTRNEWALPENLVCGEDAQGVLLRKNDKTLISKKVLQGGVLCKDRGADEKNYRYFADEN